MQYATAVVVGANTDRSTMASPLLPNDVERGDGVAKVAVLPSVSAS